MARRKKATKGFGGEVGRVSIVGEMAKLSDPPPATPFDDAVHRHPEPDEAVAGAQWDEVAGRWVRWNHRDQRWVPVD